ncbi:MAG: hypothetical protein EB127_15075 [Alphaproteobacteria bacterium]|nr:hypothetical protein [Alphaproteobacteria bacterium]
MHPGETWTEGMVITRPAATAAPVAMYGTDNPSGFGAGNGGVPFTYGDDLNPLTALGNPTQAFANPLAHAQALAGSTIPTLPVSPVSFLQAQGVPSKILK